MPESLKQETPCAMAFTSFSTLLCSLTSAWGQGALDPHPQQIASEFVFLDKPLNLSELQSHPCEMVRVTRPSGGLVGGLLGSLRENECSALEKAKSRYLLFRAILFDG